MKILYLVHQFYPEFHAGTEKFVFNVASMTQKAGHKVKVISYSFYDSSFYDRKIGNVLLRNFEYEGVPVLALRHKKLRSDLHHHIEDEDIATVAGPILEAEGPDVVHVCHPMRVGGFVRALERLCIPYLVTLTDFFLLCPKVNLSATRSLLCSGPEDLVACRNLCPELEEPFLRNRLNQAKELLFGAKKLVAPSRFLATMYQKEIEGLKVKVINHGINLRGLKKNQRRYDSSSKICFGYAGSLNSFKGPHVAIEAFSRIDSPDARLKIFGGGTDRKYMEKLHEMIGKDGRIEYRGEYGPGEVWSILQDIDVLTISSVCYESYSILLHEAFAAQVPVVVSDLGALAEKVVNGVNGFSFDVGNVDVLSNIMKEIVNNPTQLNALKEHLERTFVPIIEQEACVYERFYSEILTKN